MPSALQVMRWQDLMRSLQLQGAWADFQGSKSCPSSNAS